MTKKKTEHANLEAKRYSFLAIGFVFALSISLMAFEFSQQSQASGEVCALPGINMLESEIVPIAVRLPKAPSPSAATKIKLHAPIEIVKTIEEPVEGDPFPEPNLEPIAWPEPTPAEMPTEEKVFMVVEEMPQYGESKEALFQYLGNNIIYPPMAVDAGVKGIVYLSFVVNKQGDVEDIKVLKGIGAGCDEEAVRVIKSMGKWHPGRQRGIPVKVKFTVPVHFSLR